MSDDFIKVATNEIFEELKANSRILAYCKIDKDIVKNGLEISSHLHKIKGLAPMAGFNSIGELASLSDQLVKKTLDGEKIIGILETIDHAHFFMNNLIQNPNFNADELKQRIKTKYSAFLD